MCGECGKKYTGQMERNFETYYKENLHSFRSNNTNPKFAQHLLENGQPFGKIDDTMEIKHFTKKGAHINTTQRFFIYEESKKGD
jgi:hypothetical protein